jgi:hypothetical protein
MADINITVVRQTTEVTVQKQKSGEIVITRVRV